jgi:hypothetical protein
MKKLGWFGLAGAFVWALTAFVGQTGVRAAGGPAEAEHGPYRVLAPIESGNLLLFPVVRASGKSASSTPFLTLDEGIKSGQVDVTEAGRAQGGLVRPRDRDTGPAIRPQFRLPDDPNPWLNRNRGDQVNTLVLANNSGKPLLLLAGEIVTGGKQDRVIAKDRIVPAGGDPIDLSVFCIEPGRWTESSPVFGASAGTTAHGFMVQPTVRQQAMVAKDQQEVWNSVHGTIAQLNRVMAAPAASSGGPVGASGGIHSGLNTTSYAKAVQNSEISSKVDEAAAPLTKSREQVLAQLREEHAIGVVVAVRGEIVWADLFADTELLGRYWTKLVRSYAAESLTTGETHAAPTVADAEHFLDAPAGGTETSEGDVGVYRYRELHSGGTETFVLESLLPGTGYDVHISKLRVKTREPRLRPLVLSPQIYR